MPNRKRQANWRRNWPVLLVLLALTAPLVPARAAAGPGSHACCTPATGPCPLLTRARTMDCCAVSTPVTPVRSVATVGFVPVWEAAVVSSALAGGKAGPGVLLAAAGAPDARQRAAPLFLLYSSLLR